MMINHITFRCVTDNRCLPCDHRHRQLHNIIPVFSPLHTTILLQPPRVLTHRYKTHIKWRGTMWWRRTLFLSCMRTQRNTAHALWLPPKKNYQRFPLLHTRGLSSSLSFISSLTHFSLLINTLSHFTKFLSLSLSEIWKNQKWPKCLWSLFCVYFQLWLSAADR